MTENQAIQASTADKSARTGGFVRRLEFGENRDFQIELQRRVDAYFQDTGRRQRDCWQMYLKTALVLVAFAATYLLLVFVARTWWQGLLLSALLGLCAAGIGFNIQHDAGHRAYSERGWVNKLMALTLDLVGGSSYVWHWKHAVIHHRYVNIAGYDNDIELGILGRLSPHQRRLRFHRWQHYYLWVLYGFLAVKWEFVDDFRSVMTGCIGAHRFRRPHGWEAVIFVAGKAFFFAWALVIPLLYHRVWAVLCCYAVGVLVLGAFISVVFQLPHCVAQADFPLPDADIGRMASPWAVHQAQVTLDFGRQDRVLTWPLGGLNYHLEHHLFPSICHINYPGFSKIVEQTCRDFGVRYAEHRSFWTGVVAHYRWLRSMGMPAPNEHASSHPCSGIGRTPIST